MAALLARPRRTAPRAKPGRPGAGPLAPDDPGWPTWRKRALDEPGPLTAPPAAARFAQRGRPWPLTTRTARRGGAPPPLAVAGRTLPARPSTDHAEPHISGGGILFESHRHLLVGSRLTLTIQIPESLRKHFGDRAVYNVKAVICRVESFEGEQAHRIGARFLAEAP